MTHLRPLAARLAALAALSVTLVPVPSIAATSVRQQALSQALANTNQQGLVAANGELKLTLQLKGARPTDASGTFTLSFGVINRFQTQSDVVRSEMRLALKDASFKTKVNGLPVSGTVSGNGATIETRVVNDLVYIRLNDLSEEAEKGAAAMGMDLSSLKGHWVAFPVGILQYADQMPILTPVAQILSQQTSGTDPIAIKKVEKAWKTSTGQDAFRARVTATSPKLKKALKNTEVVAEVNQTTGALTRLEFGGSNAQSLKSCAKNSAGKSVCRTSGTLTVRWNGGVNLRPDGGLAIGAPVMDGTVGIAGN
jgi:hypothetical protein